MPVPVLVRKGGADGTGFVISDVATVAGDLYQLTIFSASDVASPSLTDSESGTWTRLDDPGAFANEPQMRYAIIGSGNEIDITFAFTGTGGGISYQLLRVTGAGASVAASYRDFGGGVLALKSDRLFTPGDNIPASFLDAANRAIVDNIGTQFGQWAAGGTWNGGVPTTPEEGALGLLGTAEVSRNQTNPNISIDHVSALGEDGETEYGITWTAGPFTGRAIYSEIIAGEEPPPEEPPLTNTPPTPVAVGGSSVAATNAAPTPLIVAASALAITNAEPDGVEPGASYLVFPIEGAKDPLPFDVAQIHSGHSLTDPGFHPYPGPWVYLLTEALEVSVFANIAKAVFPGSPMWWRWANEASLNPSARFDIQDWEVLIITEGVPLPLDGSSETTLGLYAANAWTNGNGGLGAPTLLFTTWTNIDDTDGPFRAMLDTYEPEWEAMADAATAALPEGAPPVYLIPGHRLMARFYDDIQAAATPAGIDSISDYFRDTIHPNDLGAYAWVMLHYACMFHVSPVGLPRDIWGPNQGWGDDNVEGTPSIPTLEQATYIQEAVWDVVTSYSRTGVILTPTLTNASPTPVSVEPSVLVCTNASPPATAVSASIIAVTSGAPVATPVEASVLGVSTTSPVPVEPGASRLAVTSSSPTATAVGGSRLALTNASPPPTPVGESALGNTLTNASPTPLPVAPSRLTVTSLAPVALAVAASVLASVAGPPVPSPVAPSRLALVARPPVALGVGSSRLALAASSPLPAPVGSSSLALTSRSPIGVPVGPSSVLDALTNASPVPLPVGASCVAVVARAPAPVGVLASVLTVTSRSPAAVAVGASDLGADATHALAPRVRRVIPGSGTTYVHRPSEVLDYSVDWSRRLAPDDTIVASTWVLSGTLSSPRPASHDDHVATVWLATPTAGVEARATNRITTAAGRTFEATLRLFSADPPVGGVGTTGETPVHRVAPGARRASTSGTSEFEQDPSERIDYSFDWVLRLRSDEGEDDQIATSVWFVSGLDASIQASTHDTRYSTVWPVVGRLGARNRVTNRITTVAGRVFETSFVVRVVDK